MAPSNCFMFLLFFIFPSVSFAKELFHYHFDAWLEKHGKSYTDETEYQHRLAIFLENSKVVERHNQAYGKGYTSYAMTLDNIFADVTDEEFQATHLMDSQNCSATTHASSGKLQVNGYVVVTSWKDIMHAESSS